MYGSVLVPTIRRAGDMAKGAGAACRESLQ